MKSRRGGFRRLATRCADADHFDAGHGTPARQVCKCSPIGADDADFQLFHCAPPYADRVPALEAAGRTSAAGVSLLNAIRSEEPTSELKSIMGISFAVF